MQKYNERLKLITDKVKTGERVPIKDFAIYLRANQTYAEGLLYNYFLKKLPIRFKRQCIIDNRYIADFFCRKLNLVLEIDGSIHYNSEVYENDMIRQKKLENLGYKVIRISEYDILSNLKGTVDYIMVLIRDIMTEKGFEKNYIDTVCDYKVINKF